MKTKTSSEPNSSLLETLPELGSFPDAPFLALCNIFAQNDISNLSEKNLKNGFNSKLIIPLENAELNILSQHCFFLDKKLFEKRLGLEIERTKKQQSPLSLATLHFNSSFDKNAVHTFLRSYIAPYDCSCMLNEQIFYILLTGTAESMGEKFLSNLLNALENTFPDIAAQCARSEERRVGKEC